MTTEPFHTSAHDDYMTPVEIVERARLTLERIDLDPASSPAANEVVKATQFYALSRQPRKYKHGKMLVGNGLSASWKGTVFLNPPGGKAPQNRYGIRSEAALWWRRLVELYLLGQVEAAVFLGFNLELLRTTQGCGVRSALSFPFCVPSSRLMFSRIVDGQRVTCGSPSHANVVVLVSEDPSVIGRFSRAFESIGQVVNPG